VFGYIKLPKCPYLILIEEASIVGQIMRGIIYKVEKLMFIPIATDQTGIASEDYKYVQMIQKIQSEKAFYFSYDMDLTKNM
jgi:hypothetical protein